MQNIFYKISFILVFVIIFSSAGVRGEENRNSVRSEDVYYLAKSINDLVIFTHDLNTVFTQKLISKNLRPGNVFEMTLEVAGKLKIIHKGMDYSHHEAEKYIHITRYEDVYKLLNRMRNHIFEEHGSTYLMPFEERTPKTSSDIFQMLREISFHFDELALKEGIETDWDTPARVYDTVLKKILPVMYEIADKAGIKYEPFSFPVQPVTSVMPRNIYKLLYYTYNNITEYLKKEEYEPVIFEEVNDCDEINPSDIFAIAQIISSELIAKTGRKSLNAEMQSQYDKWKADKEKILPGDTFRLIQYNFILSRRISEQ